MLRNVFAGRSPFGIVAVAALGACVLASIPGAIARTAADLADFLRHSGESVGESQARVYGEDWVSRLAEIRRRIPENGAYLLVDAGGGSDSRNRVRRDLAPRLPILLGKMAGGRREFFLPGRPPGAPDAIVIAHESAPPELVPTDAFLGPEIFDPAREDESIPASIDEPADGARVARPVTLRGWCQERRSRPCARVIVLVDGVRPRGGVERFPRPDVAAAVDGIGDCATAGWRLTLSPGDVEAGEHAAIVLFQAADGRYRRLGPVRFTVAP